MCWALNFYKETLMAMTQGTLGFVIVCDASKKALGVFTDGDLRRCLDRDVDIKNTLISQVMSSSFVSTHPSKLAVSAVESMEKYKIFTLHVLDEHLRNTNFASLGYDDVVKHGEIELSRKLLHAGLVLNAMFSPTLNPSINPSFEEVYSLLVGRPSKHMIRYCLERGYSSNPNTILNLMRELASVEVLDFLLDVRLPRKAMCAYYFHWVRLTIKYRIKVVWRAVCSSGPSIR